MPAAFAGWTTCNSLLYLIYSLLSESTDAVDLCLNGLGRLVIVGKTASVSFH